MVEQSNSMLVAAVRAGDKTAFGTLVNRHETMAQRTAMGMVRDYDLACELVQEATLQAYLGLDTLQDPTRFGAWFHGIVRNLCRTTLRQRRVTLLSLDAVDDISTHHELFATELTVDPAAQIEVAEQRAWIQDAIAALSPKNQTATHLFYLEGMSIEEVATVLNVSQNAVKGRLFQARKQLRAELTPLFAPILAKTKGATQDRFAIQERKKMATISTLKALKAAPNDRHVLYLFDTENRRYLHMWIGSHEGEQIRFQLEGKASMRPFTFHYFADFLQAFEIHLEEIRIARLHQFTFYAITQFRKGTIVKELDARPSDAIALALHTGSPIYVEDELMTQQGEVLPDNVTVNAWFAAETKRVRQEQLDRINWQTEFFKKGDARFTQRARVALHGAIDWARAFNHNYVGTEHLLFGFFSDNAGIAAKVLQQHGIALETLYHAAKERLDLPEQLPKLPETLGGGEVSPTQTPPIVPRSIQVLELAEAAREEMAHQYIGTEHLLLGILREGEGMAVTLLQDQQADLASWEREIVEMLSTTAA